MIDCSSGTLSKKIQDHDAKIAIFGLGRIGLPLAAVFASVGFRVTGVDVNFDVVQSVLKGISSKEFGLAELVEKSVKNGSFTATIYGLKAVKESDVVIICVPTPIIGGSPDLTCLESALRVVGDGLRRGMLVLVQSTIPPTTLRTFIMPLIERSSNLKTGVDFWLAYVPERIAPGRALRELAENVKIIGSLDPHSGELAAELFRSITKGSVFIRDSTIAEVVKVAENSFRDTNIAFANELALICEKFGVDVIEVIRLANTHPRVNIHLPGAGVGGPCLPKDPYLLLHPAEAKGYVSRIIRNARDLNDYMPTHVVELAVQGMRSLGKEMNCSKIAVLGSAYKGDMDDPRFSPSEMIVKILQQLGANVMIYDPLCEESFGAVNANSLEEAVRHADCLIVATDHKSFKGLDLSRVKEFMREKPLIVDGRRIFDPNEATRVGFKYLGVGLVYG